MGKKESFEAINMQRVTVKGNIETATEAPAQLAAAVKMAGSGKGQQTPAEPDEQAWRADQLRTQGRKGCKSVRINMAFTPENHRFIKAIGAVTGKGMTAALNDIVATFRAQHPEITEHADAIAAAMGTTIDELLTREK